MRYKIERKIFTQSKGEECKDIECPLLSEAPTVDGIKFYCQVNQTIIASNKPNFNIVRCKILPIYQSQIPERRCPMKYIARYMN